MTARGTRLVLLLAVAAAAAHGPARGEVEGTRSVFAHGLGNRALSMGSAHVALADDPSAMFWNPAGLARVPRNTFQFDQSLGSEIGSNESYAGFAMPSWRWGTAGLTFRHFGVGGIEQRDERNVLISDDLSDSETELSLGYGRPLGASWSVGGTVKMQEQRLAGFSAKGLGVDLGIQASPPWARGVSLGLSLRNAVEPSLRLDREAVPDPTAVRAGLGYRVAVGGTSTLVTALDLENPQGAPALHLGAELQLRDLAALRLGLNGGMMTAGTGMRWRNVSVDYGFENSALAAAHRLGLSWHFGATVDDSRLAARRAEDDALEKRLAQAFQERKRQQIGELLVRAEAARARREMDEALEALSVALALEPGHAGAIGLQVQCLNAKASGLEATGDFAAAAATFDLARAIIPGDAAAVAGAARCRAASDRRAARGEQIRKRFRTAMDALAADDLGQARDGFAAVLASDPKDDDAARMLQRTEQAIARRAARLVESASRALTAGRTTEAGAQLAEAARLDPHAPGLAQANAMLAKAKVDGASRTATERDPAARAKPPARASTMTDREVEQLYRLGRDAIKARRTDDALRYWEHVLAERTTYREVGAFLTREYLVRGMDAFAAGKMDEAVSWWEKVLRIDPTNVQAAGYLSHAQKQMVKTREILGLER